VPDSPVSASPAEESNFTDTRGSNSSAYPGTPRWVKLGAIAAVLVILLVVLVMVLTGSEHGPMRHIPSGSGTTPPIVAAVRASAT
jgi:hypothetical protein